MVLGSSLADQAREMRNEAIIQQANASSIRDEMAHALQLAKDLERRVAKLEADKQRVDVVVLVMGNELVEMKKFK